MTCHKDNIFDFLDIIIYIASFDADAWYKLTRIHNAFRGYSMTPIAIKKYIELATVIGIGNSTKYTLFGLLHREDDLPAFIDEDGSQHWFKIGLLHRDNDLPAFIYTTYGKYWYKHGEIYRDGDLPSRIASIRIGIGIVL